MSYAEIQIECIEMQDILQKETGDDPSMMIEKLEKLNAVIARSGYLIAETERMRDERVAQLFDKCLDTINKMSPNVLKSWIGANTAKENFYAKWLDRINRASVHISDNLRTQISYSKEELKLTRTGY